MSRLLLTFYGDDFTGSTDAMEALSLRGIPTVLFLKPPAPADLQPFPNIRAVGVAGASRSQTTEWMDRELPPIFQALRELGAPLCHYKVCSTFDSSPARGSIGRAVELGRTAFQTPCVPVIVGAPMLRRYVLFGNLFATVAGETLRIDRHPTMSRHPVTPMNEGDLRCHFAAQTALSTALVDVLALQAGAAESRFRQLGNEGAEVVFFDTLDAQTLREAGRTLWESCSPEGPIFAAGSSGIEYALLEWWDALGLLPPRPDPPSPQPVDRLLVVSGSCSPVTASQIRWAAQNGFTRVPADPAALLSGDLEFTRVLNEARRILKEGGSPLIYSAEGPGDVVSHTREDFDRQLGARMGALTAELVRGSRLSRIVIAGGDTSGHAGHALGIRALTVVRPFAPGSPLCRIWSANPELDGREILLKGGQVGGETLFGDVRDGSPSSVK